MTAAGDGVDERTGTDEVTGTDQAAGTDQGGAAEAPEEQAAGASGADEAQQSDADGADATVSAETSKVAELTADLQRVQAEYTNFRRRTAREHEANAARAKGAVLKELLAVLDDLDRARQHGDLESGPLKAIGDKIVGALGGLGLEPFGEPGEVFDPEKHEAVSHSGDGASPVLDAVFRKGYRLGDVVLRHAMVTVADAPEPSTVPDADNH